MQQETVTLSNVLVPKISLAVDEQKVDASGSRYRHLDIVLKEGRIASIADHSASNATEGTVIDCTNKMLLPGFVNGHTHSSEIWARGEIDMYPLELWLPSLINFTPEEKEYTYMSCIHNALETLKSGATSVLDHLSAPPGGLVEHVEAAVDAYRKIGIRAFIAPLIGDLGLEYTVPLPDEANYKDRVFKAENTQQLLEDMATVVKRFHRPEEGINILIGPTGIQRCSDELFKGLIKLSEENNLARHVHLLETRAQNKLAHQKYGCSATKHLKELGFLNEKTSCAHSIWLDEEDIKIMHETKATAVHNALSNLRLGSGIAPIPKYKANGVNVAYGCDGSASNDSQDMLEAIKIGTLLHNITDLDYRNWQKPMESVKIASLGGATGLGEQDKLGSIEVGKLADVVLYDLKHLSLLPRTDPVGMLIMGRPYNVVEAVWVGGKRVISEFKSVGVDEEWVKQKMFEMSEWKLTPRPSPLKEDLEPAYRAGMGLPN